MTARNDDDRRDAEYDGVDALMAALTDDPLPEGARQDASFMAAHRAATADVALLREQLLLMGDTLAHETAADVAGPEAGPRTRPEAADPAGRAPATGPADGPRDAHADVPGAGGDPSVTVLPVGSRAHGGLSGRRSRPRALRVALRGLVAAAAAGVVVGMGWLVVQGDHESADDTAGSSAADSAAGPARSEASAELGHARYLACARLVAEGTVAEVEPVPGTGQDRVTLDVDRYYKPAKGQDRIVFPMDEDAEPQPRPGDRVLVGITRGQAQPDLWSVGEKAIAPERAWITAAPAKSGTRPCE
ncbi:hypothetical protein [Streptomyces sp. DH10]|uniref:hypothetical protein n=1 Tax=Streptomyces sp. DH10 TaxID=3040121 RepID=UPI0024434382|nr:hypothetical protein [Streptomyces sp. DH10]MDG9712541.1 hypothetical protein [Streptomyces sp. DH10]